VITKRLDPDWCVSVKGSYTNLEGTYEMVDENTNMTTYQCPISDTPSLNKYTMVGLTSKKLILKSLLYNKKGCIE
jgi:hypothetical protein